jgi:hypothetical protein
LDKLEADMNYRLALEILFKEKGIRSDTDATFSLIGEDNESMTVRMVHESSHSLQTTDYKIHNSGRVETIDEDIDISGRESPF